MFKTKKEESPSRDARDFLTRPCSNCKNFPEREREDYTVLLKVLMEAPNVCSWMSQNDHRYPLLWSPEDYLDSLFRHDYRIFMTSYFHIDSQ